MSGRGGQVKVLVVDDDGRGEHGASEQKNPRQSVDGGEQRGPTLIMHVLDVTL